jgi:hypothetical protein
MYRTACGLALALAALQAQAADVENGRRLARPGVSTERLSLFLSPCRSADRIGDGGGIEGEHERITVVERPLAELMANVDQGRIADAKLLTLVLALRLRRPDLFV